MHNDDHIPSFTELVNQIKSGCKLIGVDAARSHAVKKFYDPKGFKISIITHMGFPKTISVKPHQILDCS